MAELNENVSMTLKTFGVLKAPKAPSFDKVLAELFARDGKITSMTASRENGCVVEVALQGNGFAYLDDDPGVALATAFAQALEAEPRQARLIPDDA